MHAQILLSQSTMSFSPLYSFSLAALPCLSAIGIVTTWIWSYDNRLFKDIVEVVDSSHPCLPGTSHPLLQWTSFTPLDRFLAILVTFFYPPIEGSNPTAALQAFHFVGQLIAVWTVMLLESVRPVNRDGLLSRYVRATFNNYASACNSSKAL